MSVPGPVFTCKYVPVSDKDIQEDLIINIFEVPILIFAGHHHYRPERE